jgi:hypothetical protein
VKNRSAKLCRRVCSNKISYLYELLLFLFISA